MFIILNQRCITEKGSLINSRRTACLNRQKEHDRVNSIQKEEYCDNNTTKWECIINHKYSEKNYIKQLIDVCKFYQ